MSVISCMVWLLTKNELLIVKYWHLIAEHEESYGYGPGEEEKTEGKIVFL